MRTESPTGNLLSLERTSNSDKDWRLVIELPAGLQKYVVAKGSIAIEGISLTVASVQAQRVTVAIIPHTHEVTNLKSLKPGALLNIEVDVLAKYAEKMAKGESAGGITIERLVLEGF